jgi:hypothetical protein
MLYHMIMDCLECSAIDTSNRRSKLGTARLLICRALSPINAMTLFFEELILVLFFDNY